MLTVLLGWIAQSGNHLVGVVLLSSFLPGASVIADVSGQHCRVHTETVSPQTHRPLGATDQWRGAGRHGSADAVGALELWPKPC